MRLEKHKNVRCGNHWRKWSYTTVHQRKTSPACRFCVSGSSGTFSGWVYWVIKQQARSHSYPELRNFSSFEISYERCGKSERSLFVEGKGQDSDNLSTPPLCFKITNCIAGFFSAGTEHYYWILKHVLSKAPFPGRASHLSFSQVAVLVPCLISKAGD